MRVLIVEDDPVHAGAAAKVLEQSGHQILILDDAEKAVRFLRSATVDLVVLDWQLPKMSGFEVLHWIRANLGSTPQVLFLTSKVLEVDVVLALEAGANDYVVKPFRFAELGARVNALLRRTRAEMDETGIVRAGDYVLNPRNRTVTLRGTPIELTSKEFQLAALFFTHIGKLLTREVVCVSTWGRELDSSRTLDTHVYRIRQKLSLTPENGLRLSSIYTLGYRLDEVTERAMSTEPLD
ncbi:response regulator transcription factor [bacterium M00.F.Ca.ET.228.01.1.1]|nr:response regulator transcription factor [bacterium M00.F.Ca.ET.228.01.1.1]TGS03728.1 response regulator transcription factor [bacterium M00.F.Ca.ET.191.01.1.1]TGU07652.1 response regulator transcription factor [bacterium M00.F.Ca.ET.155.01.1.1]